MKTVSDIVIPGADVIQLVSVDLAWDYRIIPCSAAADLITLYCDEKSCTSHLKEELEVIFDRPVSLIPTGSPVITKHLISLYRRNDSARQQRQTGRVSVEPENYLDRLIAQAWEVKASDIHLEPCTEHARIRFRIDGHLVERAIIDSAEYPALVNRIKIKANLDIAEKRLPQDGRIMFVNQAGGFDIRVSTLPTIYGEKTVMRLLSRDSGTMELESLGFDASQLTAYKEEVRKNQGIILISGPTGSGKTTTLYATLRVLNRSESNILTIEDPVEYTLEGINQVQLKESIGLGFARALRTFLRQDPDIIMLGEIRDNETAQMAVRAALTGHLVLSTIHTNSAWGTISRLADMSVSPYLIAGTLNMSLAQRLVRRLCRNCRTEVPFDSSLLPPAFTPPCEPDKVYEPCGCEQCYYTGYKGRKAVYEVIPVDDALREAIRQNRQDITPLLKAKNISTLSAQAWALYARGETSLAEVYPILMNENY